MIGVIFLAAAILFHSNLDWVIIIIIFIQLFLVPQDEAIDIFFLRVLLALPSSEIFKVIFDVLSVGVYGLWLRFDLEFTALAVERVRYDRILELDHREENLIQCALSVEVHYVHTGGGLADSMDTILRLKHQSRCPVHLSKDDSRGGRQSQTNTGRCDRKNRDTDLWLFLELLDLGVAKVTLCRSIDSNVANLGMFLLHVVLHSV